MLNLLKFRALVNCSDHPELAPAMPISGAEAFNLYIQHKLPYLGECGGDVALLVMGGPYLVGPAEKRWDMPMLIHLASVMSFLTFASHEGYLAGLGHLTAALGDTRLLPLSELPPHASPDWAR